MTAADWIATGWTFQIVACCRCGREAHIEEGEDPAAAVCSGCLTGSTTNRR